MLSCPSCSLQYMSIFIIIKIELLLKALIYFCIVLKRNHVFPNYAFKTPIDLATISLFTKIPYHSPLYILYMLSFFGRCHILFFKFLQSLYLLPGMLSLMYFVCICLTLSLAVRVKIFSLVAISYQMDRVESPLVCISITSTLMSIFTLYFIF